MGRPALYQRYLKAQLDRDRPAALRVLLDDGLGAGVSVPELYLEVIQPAQYQIGRLWQANAVTVAETYVASGISHLALSMLYPFLPRVVPNGRSVFVACVGGEHHDLGPRMVADFYEMAGFSVRYLGANLPADRLVAMVREDPPDVLGLSVTMTSNVEALRRTVDRARMAAGGGLQLALGGPASGSLQGLTSTVDADVAHGDVRAAVEHSAALLGRGVG